MTQKQRQDLIAAEAARLYNGETVRKVFTDGANYAISLLDAEKKSKSDDDQDTSGLWRRNDRCCHKSEDEGGYYWY